MSVILNGRVFVCRITALALLERTSRYSTLLPPSYIWKKASVISWCLCLVFMSPPVTRLELGVRLGSHHRAGEHVFLFHRDHHKLRPRNFTRQLPTLLIFVMGLHACMKLPTASAFSYVEASGVNVPFRVHLLRTKRAWSETKKVIMVRQRIHLPERSRNVAMTMMIIAIAVAMEADQRPRQSFRRARQQMA